MVREELWNKNNQQWGYKFRGLPLLCIVMWCNVVNLIINNPQQRGSWYFFVSFLLGLPWFTTLIHLIPGEASEPDASPDWFFREQFFTGNPWVFPMFSPWNLGICMDMLFSLQPIQWIVSCLSRSHIVLSQVSTVCLQVQDYRQGHRHEWGHLEVCLRCLLLRGDASPGLHTTIDIIDYRYIYPLVMTNIAIENDHRNSGFSH